MKKSERVKKSEDEYVPSEKQEARRWLQKKEKEENMFLPFDFFLFLNNYIHKRRRERRRVNE